MSKWCDTCYRNEITGEWEPCGESCPVFGRYFGELAHHVISHEVGKIKPYVKEYAADKIKSLEVRHNEAAKKLIDEINWIVQYYENGWISAEGAVGIIYFVGVKYDN